MRARDRAFLRDLTDLISMNRVTAAYALERAWNDADAAAAWTVAALRTNVPGVADLTPAVLDRQLVTPEDTLRVKRVLAAKLYVELMSGYEDLAALCMAVRDHHRELVRLRKGRNGEPPQGIFSRFLKSEPGPVKRYVKKVHLELSERPEITIEHEDFLAAPSLASVSTKIQPSQANEVRSLYADLPQEIAVLFDQYIKAEEALGEQPVITFGLPPDLARDVTIILDIVAQNDGPYRHIFIRTFNKLKHRFLVTERLDQYDIPGGEQSQVGENIEYARLPMDDRHVQERLRDIVSTARIMADIASLLLILDEAGVPL